MIPAHSPDAPPRAACHIPGHRRTAANCSATTWTSDPDVQLELHDGVTFADTSWTVCFSSRGISDTNLVITLSHPHSGTRDVELLLGGTTRVLP